MNKWLSLMLIVLMSALAAMPLSAKENHWMFQTKQVIDFPNWDSTSYVPDTVEVGENGELLPITWEKYDSIQRIDPYAVVASVRRFQAPRAVVHLKDQGPWSTQVEYRETDFEVKEMPSFEMELSNKASVSSAGASLGIHYEHTYPISADIQLGYQDVAAIIAHIGGGHTYPRSTRYAFNMPPSKTANLWFVPEMRISQGILRTTRWDGKVTEKHITVYQPLSRDGYAKGRFYLKYY